MKILFWGKGFLGWNGGLEFFFKLINNFIYINKNIVDEPWELNTILFEKESISVDSVASEIRKMDRGIGIYVASDVRMAKEITKNIIMPDIILPVLNGILKNIDVPYVTYIPDLQEEHLPEFFQKEEIKYRKKRNGFILNHTDAILVTSKTVSKDIILNYGNLEGKIKTYIQPCAPLADIDYIDYKADCSKYNIINDSFFLVSNQFWKHKNHITVFKAVNELRNVRNINIHVVCTGLMEDYRNPGYIEMLKKYIEDNKLNDYIHLVGFLDKKEQIGLLNRAVAVIQPTLFEGGAGGFSAQEAIVYGRPVILSNIEINRELEVFKEVSFFEPFDFKMLADIMERMLMDVKYSDKQNVLELYEHNLKKLALFYYELVNQSISLETTDAK